MPHIYIDTPQNLIVTDYLGHDIELTTLSSVHLENCEFTLSVSEIQKTFLRNLANGFVFIGDIP